jgi:hypothetical protein
MDAVLILTVVLVLLFSLVGLAATFGVDSRDGFADDRYRTFLR